MRKCLPRICLKLVVISLLSASSATSKEPDNRVNDSNFEKSASSILRNGSQEEALEALEKLININPEKYLGERGRYFLRIGETDKAMADFNKAVELNPSIWLIYRAKLHADLGQTDDALKDYSRLIELRDSQLTSSIENSKHIENSKNLARALWLRSLFLNKIGKKQQSLEDIQKAASLDESFLPNFAEFAEQNDFLEVYKRCLDKLVKVKPDYYLVKRAKLFERRGEFNLALNDYNEAVNESGAVDSKAGYSPRAWALLARRDYYKHINDTRRAALDEKVAKSFERKQRLLFGFSAWPN